MVALQEDRPRLVHLAVNLRAGGPVAHHVVMDLDAVKGHGDPVADHGGLHALPFAAGLGGEFVRGLEVVERAVAGHGGFALLVVAQDLDFMPSAQIEAAIRAVRGHVLVTDGEVPELLLGHQVRAMDVLLDGVLEDAARKHAPGVVAGGIAQLPAGQVFAVEQGLEPILGIGRGKGQRPEAIRVASRTVCIVFFIVKAVFAVPARTRSDRDQLFYGLPFNGAYSAKLCNRIIGNPRSVTAGEVPADAPVLGRSNVIDAYAPVSLHFPSLADIAAPEDGRTPLTHA